MSTDNFYPMKKRRLCKTPNGGRVGSTLGKLKKTESLASTADCGIEIIWDNNSPSPTTTLALARKRRRRRQENNQGDENNELTDISFVVQKLSEITSPVVENRHSTLLEMWVSEDHNYNDGEEEFTSPPCQTRHDKRKDMLATPLNQRRTTKRTARKAARQVMLVEIRKLMDEIQKSDLSSCGNLTQRESQESMEQEPPKRSDCDETVDSITNINQKALPKNQTSTKIAPEWDTNETEGLVEDSFEWTEDDMDALILTCQLSSSGKGSLDDPGPPGPKFGSSPSSVILVPETQGVSGDQETARKPRDSHAPSTGHPQGAIVEDELWEVNFGEDDSLLVSAAQEFELSQESVSADKLKRFTEIKDNDKSRSLMTSHEAGYCQNDSKETDELIKKKSSPGRFPRRHDKSPSVLVPRKPSVVEYRAKEQKTSTLNQRTGTLSLNKKSNENNYSSRKVRSNFLPNSTSVPPLRSRPENSTKLDAKSKRQNTGVSSLSKNIPPATPCSDADSCLKDNKKALSVGTTALSSDIEGLLSGDNFAALLEDFNFDESFSEATIPAAVPSTNKTCKTRSCNTLPTASSSRTQKTTCSKDEIEKKRLEAQRRRHAKLQAKSSRPNTRNAKMR